MPNLLTTRPLRTLTSEWETVSEVNYEKGSLLYSPISSSYFTSDSEWETVSEVSFQDVPPIRDITVPLVPWKLIPVDVGPTQPLDGRPLLDRMDPRLEKYAPFFERL